MERFFNTEGPIKQDIHYAIAPLSRCNLNEIIGLIQRQKYFILHAPRQTGKTSFLLALMDYLNQQGTYHALYINVEVGQAWREDVAMAMQSILGELTSRAKHQLNDPFPRTIRQEILDKDGPGIAFNELLTQWSAEIEKPIVLMIDEIDSLVGDTLLSLLRQLRAGYDKRPTFFPQSIILCGVRDIRDYRIHASSEKAVITGGSAFNIKAESLRVGDFSQAETTQLYEQHTAATGQQFTPGALEQVWNLSQGQPWLVNALGNELTYKMTENRNRSIVIDEQMVEEAKERLVISRAVHIDQLVHKLEEPRIRRVIEPLLSGEDELESVEGDDVQYALDLGLIKVTDKKIAIANPIYQEVIPRELTYTTQLRINHETQWYIDEQGRLDMHKLFSAFQQFFREHSEHWIERFDYKEAGPQLLAQAFLQRIVNGGGQVHREYGQGRKRTDLLVLWSFKDEAGVEQIQRIVIELKIRYKKLEKTLDEGLKQTHGYMDRGNASEGHLLVFDRAKNKSWSEKIWVKKKHYQGKSIVVWGM